MSPIVLLHGIFGYERLKIGPFQRTYFGAIADAIRDRGHPVLTPGVLPCGLVSQRAQQAKTSILQWLEQIGRSNERIIVIGHSMGGLDARYMISRLGMDRHVAALLTIATPHRGSPQADWWMDNPLMRQLGLPMLGKLGLNVRGGHDLMVNCCAQFNEQVPDSPNVRYFSVSAACPPGRVPLPLLPGYRNIRRQEGDNDALVSVQSAIWGEHLETWPVHHLHTINRRFPVDSKSPVGNIAPYYLKALDQLAKRGV
jgi:triacylglycerol lipase